VLNQYGSELCERHSEGRSTIEAGVESRDDVVAGCNMVEVGVG
jgi:hypothetical protein